ncbi:MAG: hypothetical protein L0241_23145 [Planctomycetia bacterium]|nr:hypothetical protein [Planctomycetia bacterium]
MPRDRDFDRDEYGEPRKRGGSNKGLLIAGCAVEALVILAGAGVAVWYFVFAGETTAEVTNKYRPRFAKQRTKLKRIADKLPARGSVQGDTLPANLDPKPVYDVPGKKFNTAILMAEQCEDPDRELKSLTEFDLGFFADEYRIHLQWTGDKSPMVESAKRERLKDLAKRFDTTLDFAYLVVARTVRFDPPRLVNENTFLGGDLELEVFLIDLKTEKVLGSFRRSFRPDAQVMAEFRTDRKESDSAESFIYSNVWVKARKEVAAALARGTGGTFNIEPKR